MTNTGLADYTPSYMSPEQASGRRELDARTDVYALGCVLYEMLAGEPPYAGPTAQAILARARMERPRPIHPVRPAVPEALDAVIARAMAVTPADRFASAAEFAAALGPAASGGAPTTGPALRRRSPLLAMLASRLRLAWRPSRGAPDARQRRPALRLKLLAVPPFENLGSPGG